MDPLDFSATSTPAQITQATEWLAQAGYRVIRPLEVRALYNDSTPPAKLITVAILDTETTGTNTARDKILELGMVLVEVCPQTGQAYRVQQVFNELEDPGMPIPEASTRIHHITDEMVAGKRINDAELESLLATVSLVVAHNAGFDRVFVEERFPVFADKAWACSWAQIPWAEEGISSAKLEFLAYSCGFHFTGHRASIDCHALLEVLQHALPSGALPMQLQNARLPEIRVSALGAPFEAKDILKERNYRWNAEKKVWAKSVAKRLFDEEIEWLRVSVYGNQSFRLELEKLTAMNRYSNRSGVTETLKYD